MYCSSARRVGTSNQRTLSVDTAIITASSSVWMWPWMWRCDETRLLDDWSSKCSCPRMLWQHPAVSPTYALILSRVDHCNALYVNSPAVIRGRLPSLINFVSGRSGFSRIMDYVRDNPALATCIAACEFQDRHIAQQYLAHHWPECFIDIRHTRRWNALLLKVVADCTVAGSSTWNSLPNFVKDAESSDIFKARLKTHFSANLTVSDNSNCAHGAVKIIQLIIIIIIVLGHRATFAEHAFAVAEKKIYLERRDSGHTRRTNTYWNHKTYKTFIRRRLIIDICKAHSRSFVLYYGG